MRHFLPFLLADLKIVTIFAVLNYDDNIDEGQSSRPFSLIIHDSVAPLGAVIVLSGVFNT